MRNRKRLDKVHALLQPIQERYATDAAAIVAKHFDLNNYEQRVLAFSVAMNTDLAVAGAICSHDVRKKKQTKRHA